MRSVFSGPGLSTISEHLDALTEAVSHDVLFASWVAHNVHAHKTPGYAIVTVSVKTTGFPPGDVSADQMRALADLADHYSFGEVRISHEQNVILADVEQTQLYALWQSLRAQRLGTANLGLLTDIICCPGGDFCALANAKSIPIAEAIQRRFDDPQRLQDIGALSVNISGCMNACGHHHVGNIGILGVDKKGEEFYQISLGGAADHDAALGQIVGPSFAQEDVPEVIDKILTVYTQQRLAGERFIDTFNRVGIDPFKEAVYGSPH